MLAMHKADPVSRRLAKVPGIGPIVAVTLTVGVDATQFESGRHMAAWIGLTPREHSSGGKQRLGGISRAGNERLRQLLVVGAMAVIRHAKPGSKSATPWLLELLARKPRKLAACALANKTARIAWAHDDAWGGLPPSGRGWGSGRGCVPGCDRGCGGSGGLSRAW